MKYSKNVNRNRLIDSHLNELLRVACSNYTSDLSKKFKKCLSKKITLLIIFNCFVINHKMLYYYKYIYEFWIFILSESPLLPSLHIHSRPPNYYVVIDLQTMSHNKNMYVIQIKTRLSMAGLKYIYIFNCLVFRAFHFITFKRLFVKWLQYNTKKLGGKW